ncbi:SAM-dependent methyltransferase [Streptomyces sp. NPDC048349]|uniref:SAM-dependent methyltransferase n=1 Tax=Streptomyces sp. NPDC048349 TaxID=3155486 RepID=UPI00341AB963
MLPQDVADGGEGIMDRDYPLAGSVDFKRPSMARMHDFLLGGRDHYPVDRAACAELMARAPVRALARAQREFLGQVVAHLAGRLGVRQFLDVGCGFPSPQPAHRIAAKAAAGGQVAYVYVDSDPLVVAHGQALLEGNGRTAVVQGDLRDPSALLRQKRLASVIDFGRPVACLYVSVLHCVPDEDSPAQAVRELLSHLAPGSFLAVSHLICDDPAAGEELSGYLRQAAGWGRVRAREEIDAVFVGLEVHAPGLCDVTAWHPAGKRPTPPVDRGWCEYGGLARLA